MGHKRIIDYVEDTSNTFANIVDNFIPGEAYNVGSKQEWEKDIKEYSDIVLDAVGIDDSHVNYHETEPFTTKVKNIDFSKAIHDLKHDPKVSPEKGIKKTVEWMKKFYNIR
jgi:dTDP-glucose 4,6-dehydratase